VSDRARLATAFAVGIPLAVLGPISGVITIAATVFAAILTFFTFGRLAFAGLAMALGGTWATVFALAAWNCAAPGLPCGATPVDLAPHILLSIGLATLGVAAALAGRRCPV
jgi:hypothetical protein